MAKTKLSLKELEDKYRPLITDPLELIKAEHINFQPHPFVIGPRHVAHASDHHGGILGESTMEAIPCAERGCGKPLSAHTHETALFLKVLRKCTNREAAAVLCAVKQQAEEDGVAGFAFPVGYHLIENLPEDKK